MYNFANIPYMLVFCQCACGSAEMGRSCDRTLSLSGMCENVSPPAPSASVTPVPESPSAFPLLSGTGQHSPRFPESARNETKALKHRQTENLPLSNQFSLTWSLNIRVIISKTCKLHCCSLWADARNWTRSSKPLM